MNRPAFSLRTILPLVALAAVACTGQGSRGDESPGAGGGDAETVRGPADAARAWAVRVDRERATLARREWRAEAAGVTATLTGFSAGDSLRLVREVVSRGAAGREAARYYYQGAQFRYYESEGLRPAAGGAAPQKSRLVLALDERGVVVEASHEVDGATAPLDSTAIRAVVIRAREVAQQWARAATAPAPGSTSPPR